MKKTERLQLRVTAETKRALEELAKKEKRSVSNLIEYWAEIAKSKE